MKSPGDPTRSVPFASAVRVAQNGYIVCAMTGTLYARARSKCCGRQQPAVRGPFCNSATSAAAAAAARRRRCLVAHLYANDRAVRPSYRSNFTPSIDVSAEIQSADAEALPSARASATAAPSVDDVRICKYLTTSADGRCDERNIHRCGHARIRTRLYKVLAII